MVDPLDGTNGFIDGNGDFAVQIGLAVDGQCVLGVVYQPLPDVLYRAVRGEGTWIERPNSSRKKPMVSDTKTLSTMRLAASRSHRSPRMNKVIEQLGFEGRSTTRISRNKGRFAGGAAVRRLHPLVTTHKAMGHVRAGSYFDRSRRAD
jgi:3'-phosphoadenosine 5'-phosphosulfate (PAPS) 3'-phosphatase